MISRDPETGELGDTAVIAFGIPVMPLDEQKQLIDAIRAEIDPPGTENDPPAGVERRGRRPAGARRRRELGARGQPLLLTLAGLLAVALALLAVYRSLRAGAGAADPDRARDRLVGARARRSPASR